MRYPITFADYESARRLFRIDVPEFFNFGFDVIDRHAGKPARRRWGPPTRMPASR